MTSAPLRAFERFRAEILDHAPDLDADHYAEDVVMELPFAPPGVPRRQEGIAACRAFVRAGRASLPVRFDAVTDVVVHDTADPATVVVEYTITGTSTVTGRSASAPFVVVLTVDDAGRIARWREYQDHRAIAAALTA